MAINDRFSSRNTLLRESERQLPEVSLYTLPNRKPARIWSTRFSRGFRFSQRSREGLPSQGFIPLSLLELYQ